MTVAALDQAYRPIEPDLIFQPTILQRSRSKKFLVESMKIPLGGVTLHKDLMGHSVGQSRIRLFVLLHAPSLKIHWRLNNSITIDGYQPSSKSWISLIGDQK
jgi:hypothetical protein